MAAHHASTCPASGRPPHLTPSLAAVAAASCSAPGGRAESCCERCAEPLCSGGDQRRPVGGLPVGHGGGAAGQVGGGVACRGWVWVGGGCELGGLVRGAAGAAVVHDLRGGHRKQWCGRCGCVATPWSHARPVRPPKLTPRCPFVSNPPTVSTGRRTLPPCRSSSTRHAAQRSASSEAGQGGGGGGEARRAAPTQAESAAGRGSSIDSGWHAGGTGGGRGLRGCMSQDGGSPLAAADFHCPHSPRSPLPPQTPGCWTAWRWKWATGGCSRCG